VACQKSPIGRILGKLTHRPCVHQRYRSRSRRIHHATCEITNLLHSPVGAYAQGVTRSGGQEEGARRSGIMFGGATTERQRLMPAPITLWPCDSLRTFLAEVAQDGTERRCALTRKASSGRSAMKTATCWRASIVLSTQHGRRGPDQRRIFAILVEPLITQSPAKAGSTTGHRMVG